MIKINLMPATEARKRARSTGGGGGGGGGSQLFGVVLILVLVAEAAGLYVWYSSVEDEANQAHIAAEAVKQDLKKLESKKKEFEEREKAREELNKQNLIFTNLQVARTGPLEALQFLAYAMTPKRDTQLTDEITAHEQALWSLKWNPDNLWLTEVKQQDDGWVTIKGLARSTQDASELLRRLQSSIYFACPDMPRVAPVADEFFPERVTLQEFEIQAVLNFNKTGEFSIHRDDMPDCLRDFVKTPKPAAPGGKKDDKKKGKKA